MAASGPPRPTTIRSAPDSAASAAIASAARPATFAALDVGAPARAAATRRGTAASAAARSAAVSCAATEATVQRQPGRDRHARRRPRDARRRARAVDAGQHAPRPQARGARHQQHAARARRRDLADHLADHQLGQEAALAAPARRPAGRRRGPALRRRSRATAPRRAARAVRARRPRAAPSPRSATSRAWTPCFDARDELRRDRLVLDVADDRHDAGERHAALPRQLERDALGARVELGVLGRQQQMRVRGSVMAAPSMSGGQDAGRREQQHRISSTQMPAYTRSPRRA